eukprot:m.319653 g.319653  ORF g.319653 m.319653 type:complete len:574 (+) comp23341_c0_seq1:216-1937(+)
MASTSYSSSYQAGSTASNSGGDAAAFLNDQRQRMIDDLRSQLATANSEIVSLQAKLATAEARLQAAQSSRDDTGQSLVTIQNSYASQVAALEKQLREAREEIQDLEAAQARSHSGSLLSSDSMLAELRQLREMTRENKLRDEQLVNELHQVNERLSQEREDLAIRLNDVQAELDKLGLELVEQTELAEEYRQLLENGEALNSSSTVVKRTATSNEQNASRSFSATRVSSSRNVSVQEVEIAELASMRLAKAELEAENDYLRGEINRLQAALQTAKSSSTDRAMSSSKSQEEYSYVVAELEEVTTELEQLRSQSSQHLTMLDDAQHGLEQAERQMSQMQGQLQEALQELAKCQDANRQMEDMINRQDAIISEYSTQIITESKEAEVAQGRSFNPKPENPRIVCHVRRKKHHHHHHRGHEQQEETSRALVPVGDHSHHKHYSHHRSHHHHHHKSASKQTSNSSRSSNLALVPVETSNHGFKGAYFFPVDVVEWNTDNPGRLGEYYLRISYNSFALTDPDTRAIVYSWPNESVIKFGKESNIFSMEIGEIDPEPGTLFCKSEHADKIFELVEMIAC